MRPDLPDLPQFRTPLPLQLGRPIELSLWINDPGAFDAVGGPACLDVGFRRGRNPAQFIGRKLDDRRCSAYGQPVLIHRFDEFGHIAVDHDLGLAIDGYTGEARAVGGEIPSFPAGRKLWRICHFFSRRPSAPLAGIAHDSLGNGNPFANCEVFADQVLHVLASEDRRDVDDASLDLFPAEQVGRRSNPAQAKDQLLILGYANRL